MSPFSKYFGLCLIAVSFLAGCAPHAMADPEGDSPPEYIQVPYEDFDPDEIIAACKKKFDDQPETTSGMAIGMNGRFICLEDAIRAAWRDLFDEKTRQEKKMDEKLDQMIELYASIYSTMAEDNAGCELSCGTMWVGYGVGKGVTVLEDILRRSHYFLTEYPPMKRNPEFIEWDKAGRPPWPPKPESK